MMGAFDDVGRCVLLANSDGVLGGGRRPSKGGAARSQREGVNGEGDAGADTDDVEVVVIGGDADGDWALRVAWPTRDGRGGGSRRGQARADDEVVDNAGGGGAGANARA